MSALSVRWVWVMCALVSGCASLIYELLWMRRLGDWLGNYVSATQVVLAVFFGGLALGAAWAARWDKQSDFVARYIRIELAIALFGVLSPWLLSGLELLYQGWSGSVSGGSLLALRGVVVLAFFLVPTVLMGATLPLLVQCVAKEHGDTSRATSWIYSWNTLGAAVGAAVAGMVLPLWLGVSGGIWLAAGLNVCVALFAWWGGQQEASATEDMRAGEAGKATVYLSLSSVPAVWWGCFLGAGFASMAYEVLWSRALLSILGNSIYSLSAILTVYLLGLSIGGGMWRWLRVPFGVLQAILGCLGLVSLWVLASLPRWEASWMSSLNGMGSSGFVVEWLVIAALFLLPCVCIGMMFPAMVARLSLLREDDEGPGQTATYSEANREVGWVSFASTLGGVLAPLLVGLLWMPAIGVKRALVSIAALNLCLAVLVFLNRTTHSLVGWGAVCLGGVFILLMPNEWKTPTVTSSRHRVLRHTEGVSASLSVVEDERRNRRLKLNNRFSMGGLQGSFGERRQGHLPRLFHPGAKRMLALGVGTGNSVAALAVDPRTRVEAIELVPGVLPLLPLFARTNHSFFQWSHVKLVADDARHYLFSRAKGQYDVIVGDLFHSYRAGVGGLYTREHFANGRRLLRKGGIFWQWVPLYQLSPRGLRIVVRTFLDEYPVVYGVFAYLNAKTPALGLLGAGENFRFSEQSFRKEFVDASPTTKKALAGVGLKHPIQALSMVIADRRALARLAKGAPRNTRDRPLIELEMPWVRWSADWSRLGAINTRKLLSLPGAIDSWLAGFSPAWRSRLGRRYRAIKVYMESRLLLREGKPARSLQLLLRAAQTDASWLLPRQLMSNLASAQIKQKRHRAVLQMLRMFVRALPEHAESWALLGSTLYRTGDAAGALRAFARAHRLRPGLKMAFRNLVVMHIKQKRWDKAAEVMSRSALAKAFPGLLLKVALALTRQKRWMALLPLARALTTLTPVPKRAFAMVGYAYWKVGKGKQAIPFLERAVKRDPRSLHLRVWLVQACLQAQMLPVALKHAQAAARVFPTHGGIQLMLQQLASFRLVMQLKARGRSPIAPTSRPASRPVVRPTSRPVPGPLPGPVLPRVPPRQ